MSDLHLMDGIFVRWRELTPRNAAKTADVFDIRHLRTSARCLTDKIEEHNSGWLLLSNAHLCPIADKLIIRRTIPAVPRDKERPHASRSKFFLPVDTAAIRYRRIVTVVRQCADHCRGNLRAAMRDGRAHRIMPRGERSCDGSPDRIGP